MWYIDAKTLIYRTCVYHRSRTKTLRASRLFAPLNLRQKTYFCNMNPSMVKNHIQIITKMPIPNQKPPPQVQPRLGVYQCYFFAPLYSRQKAKIQNIDLLRVSDHIQIKIKTRNPDGEPAVSSLAPTQTFRTSGFFAPLNSMLKDL